MGTRIIFISGTDTGVGKTVLTALLLQLLRARGERALAVKPFCSGGRADAQLLYRLQANDLTLEQTNPFYFPEPVAPLVSARKHRRNVPLERVVEQIRSTATLASRVTPIPSRATLRAGDETAFLLIEGSGGLLVPLGEGYTVSDLIASLRCEVLVVARNRLGTINHSLLTVSALVRPGGESSKGVARAAVTRPGALKLVLMDQRSPDVSSRTNAGLLQQWLGPVPLIRVPHLGARVASVQAIRKNAKKIQPALLRMLQR